MAETTYRKPGFEARRARTLVFDDLPSTLRHGLALCLARDGAPMPLLVDVTRRMPLPARGWYLLAAVAFVAEALLWPAGFGNAESPLALQPLSFAAAHAAAIFALLFAVVSALRVTRARGDTPFPDGRYLFALNLVEVEGDRLRLTDLHTLRRVEARPGARGPSVALVFADAHEIIFEDQPRAEALAVSVKAAIDAAAALILPDDQPRLALLDPFFELRVSDDWASAEIDASTPRPLLVRTPLASLATAILVASSLLGLGLHALRNRLSDDVMFAKAIAFADRGAEADRWRIGLYTGRRHLVDLDAARFERARGNATALGDYLLFGGAHAREAEDALFELKKSNRYALVNYIKSGGPYADRADDQLFALVRAFDDPTNYQAYLASGKRHADEVRRALLPEAAYVEAMRKGNDVGPLGAFLHAYPDSPHVGEVKATIHDLYEGVLRAYAETKPSAASLRFVKALLADLEERADPSVNLSVTFTESASLPADDARFARRYGADYLPATPYFNAAGMGELERQLRDDLSRRIRSSFAHGTVKLTTSDLGVDPGRPRIAVTGEPVALAALVAPHARFAFSDMRLRVDFRAVVPARVQELAWKYTTPGVRDFDATLSVKGASGREINLVQEAEAGYTSMRINSGIQLAERIQRDL